MTAQKKYSMDFADALTETARHIIKKHYDCGADEIGKIRNITNNSVYFFTAAGGRFYLKLYRSKNRPEAGKISFVYQKRSARRPRKKSADSGLFYAFLLPCRPKYRIIKW